MTQQEQRLNAQGIARELGSLAAAAANFVEVVFGQAVTFGDQVMGVTTTPDPDNTACRAGADSLADPMFERLRENLGRALDEQLAAGRRVDAAQRELDDYASKGKNQPTSAAATAATEAAKAETPEREAVTPPPGVPKHNPLTGLPWLRVTRSPEGSVTVELFG